MCRAPDVIAQGFNIPTFDKPVAFKDLDPRDTENYRDRDRRLAIRIMRESLGK